MSFICHVQKRTTSVPELPKETPDIIYLCFPNNPTGTTITKDQLQVWVDYALKVGAVIIYDAAYEAYISSEDVPHSASMNVTEQRDVQLRSAVFQRMQDLQVHVLDLQLFQRN